MTKRFQMFGLIINQRYFLSLSFSEEIHEQNREQHEINVKELLTYIA